MGKYVVLRPFDHYPIAGESMRPEDVEDQKQRGNMPDLLANGFIAYVTVADEGPILDDMTVAELREMAKAAEVPGHYKLKKAELIEALSNV